MAQIVFYNGSDGQPLTTLPPTVTTRLVNVELLASRLQTMRLEFESLGIDLAEVKVSLPRVLVDVAELIGLTQEETARVLGDNVFRLPESTYRIP
mgnify:CR=1 FL=1